MLAAYLVIALTVTANEADTTLCRSIEIKVDDSDGEAQHFVTPTELARELDSLPFKAPGTALSGINTQTIRKRLLDLDKIEDAQVVRYTPYASKRLRSSP